MYENKLFTNYGIKYDTTYGCIKQYRCENLMWLLSILEFTHIVIIDRINNSAVHGRINIYGINGSKHYILKTKNIHNRHWKI